MKVFTRSCLVLLLFGHLVSNAQKTKNATAKDKRPNIVVILADDLGYSDIGCYGGEIATPNLDALAASGLRFRRFYNTSRCCPTRASLLTGVYNHNAGIGEMTTDRNLPGYRGFLTPNTVTIAEVLKEAGYHSGMVGKWHVSNTIEQKDPQAQLRWLNHQEEHPFFSPVEQYPTSRGFEKYYGNIWGVVDFFDPFSLVNGTEPVKNVPANYYHTNAINDSAVAYIRDFSKDDKPFFLYVAETAPHWPLHALPEDIKKYENTYKVGWDAIREARYKKMQQLGLIDPAKAPLSPRMAADLKWEDNPDKDWDARAMAVHAAMIDRMDQGIGRIIRALKETGELDNTLVLFLSDNGASPENAMQYGTGFDRPSETRAGQKIAYPLKKGVLPGPETTFSSIGPRWANVANTPYQYAKAESYEGGIRTPLIASWPAGIRLPKGSFSNRTGHVMDFMATFVELAGARYPSSYKGNAIKPMQGSSLVPAFRSVKATGHTVLFNEHFGARYVRYDGWKLVSRNREPWHLFRIDDDETELNDLAKQHPDVVQKLEKMWQDWTKENQVVPKQPDKGK
ncbi:arylsulfatase [Flavisolibacter nicotianae]|uniref:arylsulfatase n=1 Tax=Flavisolibacter nicotianae TaxID=2364882 RepID=UPI000EAD802F|nr:arylsulfatase [Flavisolibacter nicotianae]